jgi:predicted ATPase/class 3 adenylate cyclase
MTAERDELQSTIRGLESQRALLGDALVDAALRPLREKLAAVGGRETEAAPAPTLKQVSILFLDVVGSTHMSQRLDPEETEAMMDRALERFSEIAIAQGGKILKYAGDSMLAVFGADEAREDDAERAVRCGLALLDAGREEARRIASEHGQDGFDIRVGIHTGPVLLGSGVDGEHGIRGNAVNVAARMEQSAPQGRLRISHDTYAQVRGVFDVEPQPPIVVKGVDEPVVTYLVQRLKPRAFRVRTRGIEGVETRMIGREEELEILQEAFRQVLAHKTCRSVTIVADAGLGKSRLLYEFDQWAETRPETFLLFEGRATPETETQPYGMLRDMIARRVQIEDTDTPAEAKAKLEQVLLPLFAVRDGEDLALAQAHVLGHLIGLDFSASPHVAGILHDARQIRNRGFHAAARMLRTMAENNGAPVVLELEDLQWADEPSLDFVGYLMEADRDVPLLVIALTRPTLYERRPQWRGRDEAHRRIDLAPLDRGGSRVLVNELLKKLPEVPQALRELVTAGAEGNPFYMEELVRMLVDQGAIGTGGERWTLHPEKLMKVHVPATLTGVVQARLDGLPLAEKKALQEASIIGMVFWDEALSALHPASAKLLPSLIQRELVVPQANARLEGVREYAFRHQILHQVTYDTVLKRTRKELHAKVAAWLAGSTDARAGDLLAVTARHYEEAGEALEACEFYVRSAEYAGSRDAHAAVLRDVEHANALLANAGLTEHVRLRWRLETARLVALGAMVPGAAFDDALERLSALAESANDDRWRAEAMARKAKRRLMQTRYDEAVAIAREARRCAESAGDEEKRLVAEQVLAGALYRVGDTTGAERLARDALAQARALRLLDCERLLLQSLSIMTAQRDDPVATLQLNREELALARKGSNRTGEVTGLSNVATVLLDLGEPGEAREKLEEALRLVRIFGPRQIEVPTLQHLAELALWERDDVEALALARAAVEIASTLDMPERMSGASCVLGEAELAVGRYEAAMLSFERAADGATKMGTTWAYDAYAGQARVALAQGDARDAARRVQPVLSCVFSGKRLEHVEVPRLILWTCYRVLAANADPRAEEMLAIAYANVQERAASISDERMRKGFLENVPEHREIVAASNALSASPPPLGAPERRPGTPIARSTPQTATD